MAVTRIGQGMERMVMDDAEQATLTGVTPTRDDMMARVGTPHRLVDCMMTDIDLAGLDLTGWTFERCDLREARFAGAGLQETLWRSCRGARIVLTGADLSDARIERCDFNNGVLRRAVLNRVVMQGSKLTGADLTDARTMEIAIADTLLTGTRIDGLDLRKQAVVRMDFADAILSRCDFRGAVFEECSLRDAQMTGCRFDSADLRGADLGGLRLTDATRFRGATVSRAQAGMLLAELGLRIS